MTDKPELLPCPFCGGEAESDLMQPFRGYRTGEPLSQPAVYCTNCSAQIAHYPGDIDLPRDETMELVTAAWNTRATPSRPEASALLDVVRKMLDDYQTSDAHHPLHVLVRLDHFDEARAALTAWEAQHG